MQSPGQAARSGAPCACRAWGTFWILSARGRKATTQRHPYNPVWVWALRHSVTLLSLSLCKKKSQCGWASSRAPTSQSRPRSSSCRCVVALRAKTTFLQKVPMRAFTLGDFSVFERLEPQSDDATTPRQPSLGLGFEALCHSPLTFSL